MKTIRIDILISLGSLLLACVTSFAGLLLWYTNSEKKKYAAERDFNHIRRNQEQLQTSLDTLLKEIEFSLENLSKEIDRRFDVVERDILEIKTILGLNRHDD